MQQAQLKVLIIGASGFSGGKIANFLQQQANVQLTCLVRTIENLAIKESNNLKIVKGDLFNENELNSVMAGQDAVISSFGTKAFDKQMDDRTKAAEALTKSMKANGVKKIQSISGAGIMKISDDQLMRDSQYFPKGLLFVSEDHLGAYKQFLASDLDFVLWAVPHIVDDQTDTNYVTSVEFASQEADHKVNVGSISQAIYNQLTQNNEAFNKKRVHLANKK